MNKLVDRSPSSRILASVLFATAAYYVDQLGPVQPIKKVPYMSGYIEYEMGIRAQRKSTPN